MGNNKLKKNVQTFSPHGRTRWYDPSFKALDVLPDKNVSDKIKGILMKGKEFNEIWKVEQPGDGFVYFSALKSQEIGFKEDYQFFGATLELSAQSDPSYMTA